MTCPTCTTLREDIRNTSTSDHTRLRALCVRLIRHQLAAHPLQRGPLPWSYWPQLGVCPHCVEERQN